MKPGFSETSRTSNFFRKRLAVFYVVEVWGFVEVFSERKSFGLHHNQICPPVFKLNHQIKTSPFAHAGFIVFLQHAGKVQHREQSTQGEERWGAHLGTSSCLFLLPPVTCAGQTLTLKKGFKQPLVALNSADNHPHRGGDPSTGRLAGGCAGRSCFVFMTSSRTRETWVPVLQIFCLWRSTSFFSPSSALNSL